MKYVIKYACLAFVVLLVIALGTLVYARSLPLPTVGMTEDELLHGPIAAGTQEELPHVRITNECIRYVTPADEVGRKWSIMVHFDADGKVTRWEVFLQWPAWRVKLLQLTGY